VNPAVNPPRRTPRWLGAALLLTLAATLWSALQSDEDALASVDASPPRAARGRPAAAPSTTTALPGPRSAWPALADAAREAWGVPPPPPPPAAPTATPVAEAPRAPPFPYQVIGRFDDGPRRLVLLGGALRSLGVAEGEVLDGQWRVERVTPQQMTLTWLPGGSPLTLSLR